MKRIPQLLAALCGLAVVSGALQFDLSAARVGEGTQLSEMGATLEFALDGVPDGTRPATGVFGPDGNPPKYHFQFDYDALYLPQQDQGHSVTWSLLTVTVCGNNATRSYNNLEYTPVTAFPVDLPDTFGPGNLPFPDCSSNASPRALSLTFSLAEPSPNPFNPSTRLRLTLPGADVVELSVFDLLGRRVETLFAGTLAAGTHDFAWQPRGIAGGSYFVLAVGRHERQVRRVVLLR